MSPIFYFMQKPKYYGKKNIIIYSFVIQFPTNGRAIKMPYSEFKFKEHSCSLVIGPVRASVDVIIIEAKHAKK